ARPSWRRWPTASFWGRPRKRNWRLPRFQATKSRASFWKSMARRRPNGPRRLKRLGVKVDLAAVDNGTGVARLRQKSPPRQDGWHMYADATVSLSQCAPQESVVVKVFGRRPSRTFPPARRPASENLRGTKPREGARIGRCRALSYGDLAVGRPQLRWAVR